MKKAKRWIAFGLTVMMTLGLAACAPKFDASAYVKATLDTVTRNDVEKFMELTKASKEDAEKVYTDNLEQAASMLDLTELSDELAASYNEYIKKVLAQTKYTVLEAKKTDNGFAVDVEVEPLKAFDGAVEVLTKKTEEYVTEMTEKVLNGEEEPTEEEITTVIFGYLMEHLNSNLNTPQYSEKVTVTVNVEKNDDGLYQITEKSMEELDTALIDISDLTAK